MFRFAALLLGAFFLAVTTAGAARVIGAATSGHAQSVTVVPISSTLPLRTGIFDPRLFGGAQAATAFARTKAAGATYARLFVNWSKIAPPTPPHGFNAADPADYDWSSVDASVLSAVRVGLTPILDVAGAPAWAIVPGTVGDGRAGVPSLYQLGRFATALATHYDGSHGAREVHVFEVWNEPNDTLYLSPKKEAEAPAVYRTMVNAFAASVHAVSPANVVVAGGLDPHANSGKATPWSSIAPLAFMRGFLCLSSALRPTCSAQIHFDAWSHHPYGNSPFAHAGETDEVALGDLPKMEAVLHTASRLHRIVSTRPVQFWVTEIGWDTSPPVAGAAPLLVEARWTSEGLYQMWRSGISVVTWFLLQDMPGDTPYKSGLYRASSRLVDARAKPMVAAFRFPFVAYLNTDGTVSVWGRDATSAKSVVSLRFEPNARGPLKTIASLQTNRFGIFAATLRIPKVTTAGWLEATTAGAGSSPAFSLTPDGPKERYKPFGG